MDTNDSRAIRVTGTEELQGETWLSFRRKHFVDRQGAERTWSYVARTGNQEAVVVVARTRRSNRLVLIRQYRIPMEAWIYEVPAGLVDPGETLASTAHRELAEETGYRGELLGMGPAVVSSPGMCTETCHLASMVAEEEPDPHEHEASEAIEVLTLELSPAAVRALVARAAAEGSLIDAKLYAYLLQWL
jgi:8-oxo-dGTP pyrophosphatase MutT (NUDIX family)